MTATTQLPILTLKKRGDERIRSGHHWIFSNELMHVPTDVPAGSLVEIHDSRQRSHGAALFNPHSLVAARLLKIPARNLDEPEWTTLFAERITHALRFRERIFPTETSYRLIFGESDLLPGVIIDRYGDFFSMQTLAAGMDARKELLVQALRSVFPSAQAVIEKNNSNLRLLEGLEQRESVLWSADAGSIPDDVIMHENGLAYSVSVLHGQKTGYFLDQKLNRKRIQELVGGMRVLDCFTNQGGFALNAARGGAAHVLGIDSSKSAIERCRVNARLNALETVAQFEVEEVFEFLQREVKEAQVKETQEIHEPQATQSTATSNDSRGRWDCIILDPPAFTKSRKQIPVAKRGYAKINRMALKLLSAGGLLATGSCSHHISEAMFLDIVQEQAFLEGRELRLIFHGTQSPCHPILLGMPETRYLKFFLFEVL